MRTVQSLSENRNQKLSLDVPDQPVYVYGDPARLLQVQDNLLTNAIKYTPAGGEIQLTIAAEAPEAVIRVRDNGNGIPPNMLEKIFDLFVQSDETLDRSQGGMGVGLTLVRSLVALHGGKVAAHSEGASQGSEFVVRLPLTLLPQHDQPASGKDTTPLDLRIVVVEDNADSRYTLRVLLERAGCRVALAGDGPSGLETIQCERPDVAIVDIGLPGMSGYEVCQRLRADLGQDAPYLIALTGYGRDEDREAVQRAGFDRHWIKPVDRNELLRQLRQIKQNATAGAS
jgi:CheY-like chemotaxis protein